VRHDVEPFGLEVFHLVLALALEQLGRIEEAKEAIKKWTQLQKDAEAKIWQALGDAGVGELPGGGGFKVVRVNKEPYTVAASSYKYLKQIKVKE
jgi:hypothetical protein